MATVTSHQSPKPARHVKAQVNPYQAPVAFPTQHKPTRTVSTVSTPTQIPALHSARAIAATTFLGGVIAGAILIARNHALLRSKSDAVIFLFGACCWQVCLIAVSLSLPFVVPGTIWMMIGTAHALVFQQIASHLFAKPYESIAAGNGKWASGWYAAAAVLGTMVATLSIAIPLLILFD